MENNQKNDNLKEERDELRGVGGANSDHNNAAATRGGTTDMDRSGTGSTTAPSQSGATPRTQRTVTGSDYDGQVAGQ